MLGSLILYLKGMRIMMFQLSGYYCRPHCLVLDLLATGPAPQLAFRVFFNGLL